jgi:predicted nucleic acid-binding protein
VPERVVFDTNVWISGLLWRGKPYQCLLLAHTGVVQVVYCPQMLAELSRKLRQSFRFSEDRLQAVLYDLRRVAKSAVPLPIREGTTRDKRDSTLPQPLRRRPGRQNRAHLRRNVGEDGAVLP